MVNYYYLLPFLSEICRESLKIPHTLISSYFNLKFKKYLEKIAKTVAK